MNFLKNSDGKTVSRHDFTKVKRVVVKIAALY